MTSLEGSPALVLNADFRPLSYFPLSLWPWQTAVKAVFLDRVIIVSEYDRVIHSPSTELKLPSVIALKRYIKPAIHPAFTRFNLFLRDLFHCQYCGADRALEAVGLTVEKHLSAQTAHNIAPDGHRKGGNFLSTILT